MYRLDKLCRHNPTTILILFIIGITLMALSGCGQREKITSLAQLKGKEFAVPTGTVADQLVRSRFPDAKFKYYNSASDAALAVKAGKADAAAYDEPILRNIAAKIPGLTVLPEKITTDQYGFAVRLEDKVLKAAIDNVISEFKQSGEYDDLLARWLPQDGGPKPMPKIEVNGGKVIRFGTAAVTEPFSFVDGSTKVVGMDIEIASLVAKKLNRKLEIVNMDFGALIPALISGKVDIIGACITITDERSKKVLFSDSYYTGGISALVQK